MLVQTNILSIVVHMYMHAHVVIDDFCQFQWYYSLGKCMASFQVGKNLIAVIWVFYYADYFTILLAILQCFKF